MSKLVRESIFENPSIEEVFTKTQNKIKNENIDATEFALVLRSFFDKGKLEYIEELVLNYIRVPFGIFPVLEELYFSDTHKVLKYVIKILARNDMEELIDEFLQKTKAFRDSENFKEIKDYIKSVL